MMLDVRFSFPEVADRFQYYRQPHDVEIVNYDSKDGGRVYRGDGVGGGPVRATVRETNKGMPEVYRYLPDQVTSLSCGWINLWYGLNPELTLKSFCTLLDNHLAFTNNTGWPGRYNCLTGEMATGTNPLQPPAFHAGILCGGAIVRKIEQVGGELYFESLLSSEPVPTAQYVLERPYLWFYGMTVIPSGKVNYMVRLGRDGTMKRVRIPIITRYTPHVPVTWLDELPPDFIPPESNWLS